MANANSLTKMLENFYSTCKYEKFYFKYMDIQNDKKINDETKNYLRILHTNFLFLIDEKKAFREYDRIFLPTENKYLQAYYFLGVIVQARKKNFDEAKEKLDKCKKYKSLSKEDMFSLQLFIDIYSDKDIKDIEKMFPLNNKVLYQNIFNARLLMDYYALKGDEKTAIYANYILKQKTDFTDSINKAKEIASIFKK